MTILPRLDRIVIVWMFVLVMCSPICSAKTWRQYTFEHFRQGQSDDGGVNLYAAADGTLRTTTSFDYNSDGANDILFVCSHDNGYAPPTYIYPNDEGRFDRRFRWLLLNEGAHGGTIADLNDDGWSEVILCGTMNGMNFGDLDSLVYYGHERGHALSRSTRLPTFYSRSVAVIDADGDAKPDLAFARGGSPGVVIYINRDGKFSASRSQTLEMPAASCLRAADFSRDGRADLIVLAGSRLRGHVMGDTGLEPLPAFEIDVPESGRFGRFVSADLNADGYLDLVVTDTDNQAGGTTVYYGDVDLRFKATKPVRLPSRFCRDVAIADVDRDGHLDLIAASFGNDNATGDWPTSIFMGGDDGFDVQRRYELQTRFATGLAVADFDHDGWEDLAIACNRNDRSHNVDSYVYYNRQGQFPESQRIAMPTLGAVATVTGDVDGNGQSDVMFLNRVDGTKGLSKARLYWNDGTGNFSTERMTRLPIRDAFGHLAADLNLDGHLDIVFANSYEYGRFREQGSYVYWGGTDGTWSPDRLSLVPTEFAVSVVSADLNRDGWLDLAFGQLVSWERGFKPEDRRSRVFYGGRDGFDADHMTELPVEDPRGIIIADLNKDGWIDIAASNLAYPDVPIFWGSPNGFSADTRTQLLLPNKGSVTLNCADLNHDGWLDLLVLGHYDYSDPAGRLADRYSYVFWGSPEGFDTNRRVDLPTIGAQASTIADFNQDGLLDLFIPSYTNGDKHRTWTSFLYYNDPRGFSPLRRTGLITDSGSGGVALDYNRDGYLDLAVACHMQRTGDHRANSFLFYGGPQGFDDYNKLELPTEGSHDITYTDPGHVYHRRFEVAFTSGIHDAGRSHRIGAVRWRADTPHGSRLQFQVRASDDLDSIKDAAWIGAKTSGEYIDRSGDQPEVAVQGRFIQYRAMFRSRDGSNYPVLRDVRITLRRGL